MNISHVAAYGGEEQRFFSVYVHLLNPGKEASLRGTGASTL